MEKIQLITDGEQEDWEELVDKTLDAATETKTLSDTAEHIKRQVCCFVSGNLHSIETTAKFPFQWLLTLASFP